MCYRNVECRVKMKKCYYMDLCIFFLCFWFYDFIRIVKILFRSFLEIVDYFRFRRSKNCSSFHRVLPKVKCRVKIKTVGFIYIYIYIFFFLYHIIRFARRNTYTRINSCFWFGFTSSESSEFYQSFQWII